MSSTVKRDLRTGRSVWLARRLPAIDHREMTRSLSTDVLIVGAGISGAMVADALVADGHDVVMIDRRGPLKGSTPATTALVQYEIDEPVISLTRRIGTSGAQRAWRRSHQAVQNLSARIDELAIDCDLERRHSLYLAGNELGAGDLKRECAARRLAGIETIYLTKSAVEARFGISGRSGALLGYGNLELEPVRLAAGFLQSATAGKARIYAPVEAVSFKSHARHSTVATSDGLSIDCKTLIFCSGYEIPESLPRTHHQIISTWALATTPQPSKLWPERAFIWEASDPYLYMRTTPDGRVVCGGEDEDFSDEETRDSLTDEKIAVIRQKLGKLFPQLDTMPDFAWAANFGMSDTGLPTIGSLPDKPNVYVLMGFGGNGITYSRVGAELLRAALAGTPDPDADLFAVVGR